jgi:hypothetical protein
MECAVNVIIEYGNVKLKNKKPGIITPRKTKQVNFSKLKTKY